MLSDRATDGTTNDGADDDKRDDGYNDYATRSAVPWSLAASVDLRDSVCGSGWRLYVPVRRDG